MTRPTKAGDKAKNPLPRNQPDDKTVRCTATEGAQQCLSATHHHLQNHRWGPKGETDRWNEDGSPKSPVRAEAEAVHPVWGEALQPEVDPAADTLVEELPPDPHAPDPAQARDLEEMEQHRQEVRDRLAGAPWPDAFNGDNAEPQSVTAAQAREALANEPPPGPLLADVRDQARSQGVVRQGTDEQDRRDLERLRSHPDVQSPDGPRPVSVSGAPGSRLSDVASRVIHLTMDGYPTAVHDEVIWTEIATHALVSMREEQARTKGPADPALVAAALDAVDHIARARGLVRGTGADR